MSKRLKLPPAQAPCSECLQNVKQNNKFIIAACPHNQAVALMKVKNGKPEGVWRIFSPSIPAEVAALLKTSKQAESGDNT